MNRHDPAATIVAETGRGGTDEQTTTILYDTLLDPGVTPHQAPWKPTPRHTRSTPRTITPQRP